MKKELPWSLTITRALNGYVLTYDEELISNEDNPVYTTKSIAIEDPADGNEAVTAKKLLWEVLEHFGVYHDGIEIKLDK